jgi:peroxiredoxin
LGAALAALFLLASPATAEKIEVGKPAPNFQAIGLDGSKISLTNYRGKVLLINLWALWCTPCWEEMPALDGYGRAQSRQGLAMLAVLTEGSPPDAALRPLVKAPTLPFARKISSPYGSWKALPMTYVIDRRGVVRYAEAGELTPEALNRIVAPLLREPAPVS